MEHQKVNDQIAKRTKLPQDSKYLLQDRSMGDL